MGVTVLGNDIQCCTKHRTCSSQASCNVGGKPGSCMSKSAGSCPDGTFTPGYCPGSTDIQCCTQSSTLPSQNIDMKKDDGNDDAGKPNQGVVLLAAIGGVVGVLLLVFGAVALV